MNLERVDLLIQAALAAAAQRDFPERELGPIHLIKYVYLADLAYATRHGGETFTGVPWRFHHFGPWAVEVFQRLDPATEAIQARRREFTSQYRDDNRRWSVQNPRLLDEMEGKLPAEVYRAVRCNVSQFGADTMSLLHHVYKTPPMLRAAPEERLTFDPEEAAALTPPTEARTDSTPDAGVPSKTTAKKLRERVRAKLAAARETSGEGSGPAPRFDEVFAEGVRWLDSLAGGPIEPDKGRLSFADTVWHSAARREPELP